MSKVHVRRVTQRSSLSYIDGCPFCGAAGILASYVDRDCDDGVGAPQFYVICRSKRCKVTSRTITCVKPEAAIRAWNKRWRKTK